MTLRQLTITDLKLSLQSALIGEVTSNMAAVTCALRQNLIVLRCYYFGMPSEADKQRLLAISSEVIADFPAPYDIVEECVSYHSSRQLPDCLDFWAFMRAEVEEETLAASQLGQ